MRDLDPFDDLPVVISTPGTDPGWVRTSKATWTQLETALHIRERSLDDLVSEVMEFGHLLDLLKPYMVGTNRTVAEAVRLARRGVR